MISRLSSDTGASQYEQVKLHVQELLDRGVVRPSCSPYSSPIVAEEGEMRLCVDYRLLNVKTRKQSPPSPGLSLDALSAAQLFTTLDLASGYNQVTMAERDKAPLLGSLSSTVCHLAYAMCPARSRGSWSASLGIKAFSPSSSTLMI